MKSKVKKEPTSPPKPRSRPRTEPVILKSDPSDLTSTFEIEKPIKNPLKVGKKPGRPKKVEMKVEEVKEKVKVEEEKKKEK